MLSWAHLVSCVLFACTIQWFLPGAVPRSVYLMELALSVLVAGGSRFVVRLYFEGIASLPRDKLSQDKREIIVLGAGDSGHLLIKYIHGMKRLRYRPIGILDDSERKQETLVHGVQVIGTLSQLPQILETNPRIIAVLLAIPSLAQHRIDQIKEVCCKVGVAFKRLQSFEDIAVTDAVGGNMSLTIEAVLSKEQVVEHEKAIRDLIEGKRILVTGAGGSVGSELIRQICHFNPAKVVLFDSSEYNLFKINLELRRSFSDISFRIVVGSICNPIRLDRVFAKERPEIVFHAAAYKHVPMMELNSYEAFNTNVIGTRNVLMCSVQHRVHRLVAISTDKAVDPSSVMGVSKRIAELLIQEFAARVAQREAKLATAVVRFGNVINSAGSVIPLFREQILAGGPLTVTHPDAERYFMSIQEAVRLILIAGSMGGDGDIFVLDMGQRIKVLDIARKMMALYGRRDILIEFTGLRPGEKLIEELCASNEIRINTQFKKVSRVFSSTLPIQGISLAVDRIQQNLINMSDDDIVLEMRRLVVQEHETIEDGVMQAHA